MQQLSKQIIRILWQLALDAYHTEDEDDLKTYVEASAISIGHAILEATPDPKAAP